MKKILTFIVFCASLGMFSAMAADWGKDDFVRLWSDARKAIVSGNLARWNELIIPAKPGAGALTAEMFAEAKEFLLDSYPDLNSVKFIKFEQNAGQALFVLQTYLDDEHYITLDAFKFILVGKNWKLSGHVGGVSFPKKNLTDGKTVDIQKQIEKQLAENQDLQLPPEPPSADTAATVPHQRNDKISPAK